MSQQQVELQCQSCGMPLTSPEVYGSNSSGAPVQDYCSYCYTNGEFTQPNFKVDDMVGYCIPFLVEQGMDENTARAMLAGSLPSLKRWSADPIEPSYSLVQLDELKLVGISTITSNEQEFGTQGKIGGLWDKFWKDGVQQSIPHSSVAPSQPIYGCYTDYVIGAAGEYKVLIGCKVAEIGSLPAGLEAKILPATRYAVFTTRKGLMPAVVIEAWQAIWKWSTSSKLKRTFTGDFELYDERCSDPEQAQVDIYIAVE
ncbi:effector binding domain-containing protein [Cohnella mopanensis]|uniref:effector binding domain-containing protein n=1 Tax=Cohnella mopanensis TaxID=2911966 RepID=UPI001EF8F570|nr:effector binding domain-containing protein [Cohnella mopanensis]